MSDKTVGKQNVTVSNSTTLHDSYISLKTDISVNEEPKQLRHSCMLHEFFLFCLKFHNYVSLKVVLLCNKLERLCHSDFCSCFGS